MAKHAAGYMLINFSALNYIIIQKNNYYIITEYSSKFNCL